jgi:hypothetical protein
MGEYAEMALDQELESELYALEHPEEFEDDPFYDPFRTPVIPESRESREEAAWRKARSRRFRRQA